MEQRKFKQNCNKNKLTQQNFHNSHIKSNQESSVSNELNLKTFQLQDTLRNSAYLLAASKIQLTLHIFCDPLEKLFLIKKVTAFQLIRIVSNRLENQFYVEKENNFYKSQKTPKFIQISQNDTQLSIQSKIVNKQIKPIIHLTKQQIIEKTIMRIKYTLGRMIKLIQQKRYKNLYVSLTRIQFSNAIDYKKQTYNQNEQILDKQDECSLINIKFERRSIDGNKVKLTNKSSFSLTKNSKITNQSPKKVLNKNMICPSIKSQEEKTLQKASTCHSKSSYPQKQSQQLMKQKRPSIKQCQQYFNQSYFEEGTQQRQLELLRSKYNRLVDQFRNFNQKFIQVIRQK